MARIDEGAGRVIPPRARGLALAAAGLAAAGLLAERLAETAWRGRSLFTDPQLAAPADGVAALAASAGLVLLAWLVVAAVLSLVSTVLGSRSASGRAVGRITGRIAPAVLRNAIAAALGVVVLSAPVAAHAAAGPARPTAEVSQQAGGSVLSPAWLPTTTTAVEPATAASDARPVSSDAPAGSGQAASEREGDLRPGWVPTRPLTAPGARRPAAPAAPVTSAPRRAAAADQDDDVVVRRGDSLWSIAARHLGPAATDAEIALDWPRWFTANRTTLGPDPDRLHPGQRLRPPAATTAGRSTGANGVGR